MISRVRHFNGNLRHHHRRHLHTHKLLRVSHYEMVLNMQPREPSSSPFHSQSFSSYVLFIVRRNFSYIQQYRFMRFKNVRAWYARAGKKSLGAIQFINCEWKLFFRFSVRFFSVTQNARSMACVAALEKCERCEALAGRIGTKQNKTSESNNFN